MRQLILIAALALASCQSSQHTGEEDRARVPQRIVSLDGTITEVLWTLGDSAALVGRDVTSTYPEAVRHLPNMGHPTQQSAESIAALRPDLVLGTPSSVNPAVAQQLEQLGIAVKLLERPATVEGAVGHLRELGALMGRDAQAAALADSLLGRVERLKRVIVQAGGPEQPGASGQSADQTPSLLFLYAGSGGNLLVAGAETPVHAMMELAGVRNAATGLSGYQAISPESLLKANPDWLLLFPHGLAALGGMEGLVSNPVLGRLDAVAAGRIMVMDGLLLTGFGPRMVEALQMLRQPRPSTPRLSAS